MLGIFMSRHTTSQKSQRTFAFLYGLRDGRVVARLATHGFTEADRDEGWALLRAVAQTEATDDATDAGTPLLAQLDAWENRWFPIARATLRTRYPKLHGALFANLPQAQRLETLLTVGTFVERVGRLAELDKKNGAAAKALLAKRGLDDATINEARSLLARAKAVDAPSLRTAGLTAEQLAKHEDALWDWYLEWSAIARVAITNVKLLSKLGFEARKGRGPAKRAKTVIESEEAREG
jgi:hypothetical protein